MRSGVRQHASRTRKQHRDREDTLWPCVLASWQDAAANFTSNGDLIGAKALGLMQLPRAWVPPFLVLTRTFHSIWKAKRDVMRQFRELPASERELLTEFFHIVAEMHGASARVLVRSNSPSEDLRFRGAYRSYNANPNLHEVGVAIESIFKSSTDLMCAIVQAGVEPGLPGHMSNERRVSPKLSQWFVSSLRHFRSVKSGTWKKLDRARLFDKIGLPYADVFLLTGDE
jgi:hypothetical protein